jgi:hypothetical protein
MSLLTNKNPAVAAFKNKDIFSGGSIHEPKHILWPYSWKKEKKKKSGHVMDKLKKKLPHLNLLIKHQLPNS